jgi:hypothetical protein
VSIPFQSSVLARAGIGGSEDGRLTIAALMSPLGKCNKHLRPHLQRLRVGWSFPKEAKRTLNP